MKYLYQNDIKYLFQKRKKILFLLLCLPTILFLIKQKTPLPWLEIIHLSMGTNLIWNSNNFLEIMIYLFQIASFLFLAIDLFTKDMEHQLEIIFLRMNQTKWFWQKLLMILIQTVILKIGQYIPILLISLWNQTATKGITLLIITDISYLLLIELLFLTIYIGTRVLSNNKISPLLFFLLLWIFIPKNIWSLHTHVPWLILVTLLLCSSTFWIIKYKITKIIENI